MPIAIVGRACVLPGALSPEALWEAVREGRDLLATVPDGRWRLPKAQAMCAPDAPAVDRSWSDRGGYVEGFESIWNPEGFAIPASELAGLDPLVHWLLHCARAALSEAGNDVVGAASAVQDAQVSSKEGCRETTGRECSTPGNSRPEAAPTITPRIGAVFGNLGFPSEGMAAFADQVWTDSDAKVDARNRYMSGGTAEVLGRALNLDAGSFALDAACASSLYAIKLACDRLQEGSADLMLAGAVQRADDLFLHIGFSALNALSRSGQSRPFHRDADGLIPAAGCAMLALKRLADARRDGDHIHAIVRGVGLSNDGRGKGLLVPDAAGQQRAMRAAYLAAGLQPASVSLLECHATGTPVGDATELRSTATVFHDVAEVPVGSLKSNLGHLITVAGAAGIIKLIGAMRAGVRPPSLHADMLTPALIDTPFRVLQHAEPWPSTTPRIAAISAFGFGGNNAHLILSEDDPALAAAPALQMRETLAIVGIGMLAGNSLNRAQFTEALFSDRSLRNAQGEGAIDRIELDLAGLRFPPRDLEQTLPQQLAMLQAAREALAESGALPRDRTAVLIGMEPDAEVARYGTRWRRSGNAITERQGAHDVIAPLESAGVIGCMPNIPANRLSAQFDLAGPAFAVQSGSNSGLHALQIASHALMRHEIDAALVGAVDLCCEPVTRAAGNADPADAAVAIVVKRLADAERDGNRIYALLAPDAGSCGSGVRRAGRTSVVEGRMPRDDPPRFPQSTTATIADHVHTLNIRLGNPGAANGLLRLTAAVLALHHRRHPGGSPWLSADPRRLQIDLPGTTPFELREASAHSRRGEAAVARLYLYSGNDQHAVIDALRADRQSNEGPARLVLVARDEEFESVRQRALAHLQHGAPAGSAVHFCASPLAGELAFVFAGAGASYSGMGAELVQQLPQLLNSLAERSRNLATALDWAYDPDCVQPSALQQLWSASALSQLHLELSEGVLGLRADAWLGYSSGETNALVAAGIWNDPDALMDEMEASGLVTRYLGGEFSAVRAQWQRDVHWASWTVLAPVEEVRAAMADVEHVHIAIINGDADCLIAGDEAGCAAVVERIGAARCLRLIYPLAVHVPEVDAMRDEWLQLHRRETLAPRHGRIYSNALGRSYTPDSESCARAILDQANRTLDLRPVVLQAWNDGVRIFVEHGPGGSFSRAIRNVLGEREALIVSLDRRGQGIDGTLAAIAALLAAGVTMRHEHLLELLAPVPARPLAQRPLRLAAHWPKVCLPKPADAAAIPEAHTMQIMAAAPALPSVFAALRDYRPLPAANAPELVSTPTPVALSSVAQTVLAANDARPMRAPLVAQRAQTAHLSRVHQHYLHMQSQAHLQFLQLQQRAQRMLLGLSVGESVLRADAATHVGATKECVRPEVVPATAVPSPPGRRLPEGSDEGALDLASDSPTPASVRPQQEPTGPRFSREQLLIHADGRISDIFGTQFQAQDQYLRQVRMPKPPLLLADRVTGIEGAPGSMGRGRIWTETDVGSQDWYLHQDHMPAGVMIEAGQADLMLISWLGVDAHNRGERVYRLLGCELTYHGDLPRRGDTLAFDIVLDGHAAQGDVRLMFFHYDCMNGDRRQLSVRKGQAGFFTDAELAESAGCLWTPEQQPIVATPRLDAPAVACQRNALDREQIEAFAAGDALAGFGPGFELARTHTRSPAIQSGQVLLLDRITDLHADGGPWQRGYLRAELDIHPQQWFFDGHFKNDPCMPGTLMFEACLQAMAIYLASLGYTLKRDGWRFQPVPDLPYQLQCRGQVTPASRLLVTEVFVEERLAGPVPTVYADLLCTVDGLKAFHARRGALQLVPDWPMDTSANALVEESEDTRPVAVVDGFRFDRQSLLACALGKPSAAFGPMYRRFDGPQRVARLPSPPYHFISRIAEVHGAIGVMQAGARVVAEYDLPESVWYLDENGCRRMPYAVLLEAVLQPCGWLSSYVGSALTIDSELGFRNLDGEGTVLAELSGGAGTLRTEVELTAVSATAGMIIENFAVRCWLDEREVYTLRTVFGFFPPEALAAQAGLTITAAHRELLQRDANIDIDLDAEPAPFFAHPTLRLAGTMLRMIDRIEGIWPDGGAAGLGQLRAVKDVDTDEWFFKAHFFQDPVQPGSLGLEAMLQSLQAFLLHQNAGAAIASPRFETIALGKTHQWKYRGQVLPRHRQVHTTLEVAERGQDERGIYAIANASLWVDGQRIYEATGLGVRIVES
jgi:acyl transferase domain-containing protein/3-hydroxymyristoyl/3-hydroxydecanoyl-(acyl carrier protein) dehydratase